MYYFNIFQSYDLISKASVFQVRKKNSLHEKLIWLSEEMTPSFEPFLMIALKTGSRPVQPVSQVTWQLHQTEGHSRDNDRRHYFPNEIRPALP